jgi:uncharacterized membrane protein YgcG
MICGLMKQNNNNNSLQAKANVNATIGDEDFLDGLKNLDFVSNNVTLNTTNKCVNKFENILRKLPQDIRNVVLGSFKNNLTSNTCCDVEPTIEKVSKAISKFQSKFLHVMSQESQKSKKGLGCFRAADVVHSKMRSPNENGMINAQKQFIKNLLLDSNNLNSKLAKCLVKLNQIVIKHIGLMCVDDSLVNVVFQTDAKGKVLSAKKTAESDATLFTECYDYISGFNDYTSSVFRSYIDELNSLMGNEKCNYLSNTFAFDRKHDVNDTLFPPMAKENINFTSADLVNRWEVCIKNSTIVPQALADLLKNDYLNAMTKQPNGLSTYVGRYDIDFDVIKKNFFLKSRPSFYLNCTASTCKSYCNNCNTTNWQYGSIVKSPSTNLAVSCCNGVCIVYVTIEDLDNFGLSRTVPGAEIFYIKEISENFRDFDPLTLAKIRNANTCFSTNDTNLNAFSVVPTVKISTTSFVQNELKQSSNLNNTTKFDDSTLKQKLKEIVDNPSKYQNDNRLMNVLKLKFNGTLLQDFLYGNLYSGNDKFYLSCQNAVCRLQCPDCSNQTYPLLPNNDTEKNLTPALVLNRSTGGSSSKSGSSGSSKSGSSGSSKSGSSGSSKSGSKVSGLLSGSKTPSSTSKSSYVSNAPTNTRPFSSPASTYYNTMSSRSSNDFKNPMLYSGISTYSKTKVHYDIKFKNSYTYFPGSYYGYNYYGFRNYDVYGYNPNFYRPPVYQNFNNSSVQNAYVAVQRIDILPEYDANDWAISYGAPYNVEQHLKSISSKIPSIKIQAECCKLFCSIYIESFDDGLDVPEGKTRVFVDVTSRNVAFFDSSSVSIPQAKCLISGTVDAKPASNENILNKCGVVTPYDIIPIKNDCMSEMSSFCKSSNFDELVKRVSGTIPSSDDKSAVCAPPTSCTNLSKTPTDAEKQACGKDIYSLFMGDGIVTSYTSLGIPCTKTAAVARTSFVQARMKQASSEYFDPAKLTPAQQQQYNSVKQSADNNTDKTIAIDNSTPTTPVTDVDSEALAINSSADAKITVIQADSQSTGSFLYSSSLILLALLILL